MRQTTKPNILECAFVSCGNLGTRFFQYHMPGGLKLVISYCGKCDFSIPDGYWLEITREEAICWEVMDS